MHNSGFELGEAFEARSKRLPLDARLLLAMGAIQRCDAFYRRSIEERPDWARYLSAVDRGLSLAWAAREGKPVDPVASQRLANKLRSFAPEDPYDPALAGDRSWLIMTSQGLAYALDIQGCPDLEAYATAMLAAPLGLVFVWYGWVALKAGRDTNVNEKTSSSAYLLELAVQARHMEWLRDRPVDADLVGRVRTDSIRAGTELVAIVDEWRGGP
jgi:hypothetical protein